jgi:hypothetical protein
LPGELYCGPPKSRASCRTIALDKACTQRLVDQAIQQNIELLKHQFTEQRRSDARARTGPCWRRGRAMFTYADGRPIRPEYLTHRFRQLTGQLGLPPIRLHDYADICLMPMSGRSACSAVVSGLKMSA